MANDIDCLLSAINTLAAEVAALRDRVAHLESFCDTACPDGDEWGIADMRFPWRAMLRDGLTRSQILAIYRDEEWLKPGWCYVKRT